MKRALASGIVLIALAGLSDTALAAGGTARAPMAWRTWTLEAPDGGETTVSQVHVPMVATVRLGSNFDVVISGAFGSSSMEQGSETVDLAGPTDVVAQGLLRLAGNRFLLQAGANLPAGKKELTEEELGVAQALAHPVLAFPLKQYGRGFDVSAGAAAALPLGSGASAGFGGGVVIPGAYTLVENGDDFTPGFETAFTAGLDLGEGGPAALRLDGVFRMFEPDKLGDVEIFEEGDQIEVQGLGRGELGGVAVTALARAVRKDDNTIFTAQGDAVEAITEAAGTSLTGQLGAEIPLTESLRVGVQGEWRAYDGSEGSRADGSAIGVGPSALFAVGRAGWLRVSGLYLVGTLDGGDAEDTDLGGLAVSVGFFWRGSVETR